MPVRNYDNSDPKAVLRNMADVLANQDMNRLHEPAYKFLITHCGFIAHYDHEGFKAVYRDSMDAFVAEFLNAHHGEWDWYLNNPKSFLYDASYRGMMLHDIIRDLLALFHRYEQGIKWGAEAKRKVQKLAALNRLADELGYVCIPKEVTSGQET